MGLGEMCGGNAVGYRNVCLVSLGTGLGFAISADGKVLMTPTGAPLESIWNLPYNGGILEDHASKRGFYNTWEEVCGNRPPVEMTVAQMGLLASEGDAIALEVFRRVGEFIASNIKQKIVDYKIECLLFGGLRITTVSDFSNAAFKGLVKMLKDQ